ncbi:MAG: YCF48-related protein [Halioglobus sp.]
MVAEQSLQMPRASEALLLDATHVGGRILVAGDHGHILYSDDEGNSWQQAAVPSRAMLTAIHFPRPDRGWAVGHDGVILASTDRGESWTVQRDGLVAQKAVNLERLRDLEKQLSQCNQSALDGTAATAPGAPCDELDDLTFDLEDARSRVNEPVHAPPLLDVYFSDALHGVAVGAFNTLLRTTDGGLTWTLQSDQVDNPDEFHLNAVTGDGGNQLWIAAEGGLLFSSADGGASWKSLESPYHGSWFGIARAPGSGELLIFGLRGNLYRSDDSGQTWQRVEVATDRTLAGGAFINDKYVLLVGAVGTLLVSENGALSFSVKSSGTRQNLSAVTSVASSAVLVGQGGVHHVRPFGGDQ